MTERRDTQRDLQAAAAADPGTEDNPEAIQDLDVEGDDADRIVAAGNYLTYSMSNATTTSA